MKLLRLWRRYDSVKAAVMLFALALVLIGYCMHAAFRYARILHAPSEYLCSVPEHWDIVSAQLSNAEGVRGYSLQKSAVLTQNDRSLTVTYLSAAYLSDCYALSDPAQVIWANDAAFSVIGGAPAERSLQCRGTIGGRSFSGEIIRTEALPEGQPFAVMTAGAAALHDAEALRICMAGAEAALPEESGLRVLNPEVQTAAEYEKQLVLLRIRFGMLSAVLACFAAAAFFRMYRDSQK